MTIGVAAALLVVGLIVGLIVGFIVGRKTKKGKKAKDGASASAEEITKALGAAASSELDAYEAPDEDENDDDPESLMSKLEREFLSMVANPGLDDHPDTEVNPIILYQVKMAKEQSRITKLLEKILESDAPEGMTLPSPEEVAAMNPYEKAALVARLQSSGVVAVGPKSVGSVPTMTRRHAQATNSSAILVAAGAHFQLANKSVPGEDAEKTKAKELRERLRQIDQHMQNHRDIDTSKVEVKGSKTFAGRKGVSSDAFQVAKDTKINPFGGASMMRQEMLATYAARGRKRVGPPLDHMMATNQLQAQKMEQGKDRRRQSVAKQMERNQSVTLGD